MRFFESRKWQLWTLVAVVIALNANTFQNQFVLDDTIVVTQNDYVRRGVAGIPDIVSHDTFQGFFGPRAEMVAGGRYRPLSLVMFAVERQLFGENPTVGHVVNVTLYALLVVLIWLTLLDLPAKSDALWARAAWLAALLFAMHPIHTEVVANIKGRDEILCLLFAVLAWRAGHRWVATKRISTLLWSATALFLGCMAKENAVSFVFVIPFALYYFRKGTPRDIAPLATALFIAATAFIAVRQSVLGPTSFSEGSELMNNPFVDALPGQRIGTVLFTFLWYAKLLLWPHPLTFDYYPYHVGLVDALSWQAAGGAALVAGLAAAAVWGWRRRNQTPFWILYAAATFVLTSNLLFTVGTFMNERFLFAPSLAFCAGAGWLLAAGLASKARRPISTLFIGLMMFYSLKTMTRNEIWRTEERLVFNDVRVSTGSAKSNVMAGGKLFELAQRTLADTAHRRILADAERHLDRALAIHPTYNDARLLKGNVAFRLRSPQEGIDWYLAILSNAPAHRDAWRNALIAAANIQDHRQRLAAYESLWAIDSARFEPNYQIGVIAARHLGDLARGRQFLERAVALRPSDADAAKDLGTVCGLQGDFQRSREVLEAAARRFPADGVVRYNLANTYANLRMMPEAQREFDTAAALDSTINPVKLKW